MLLAIGKEHLCVLSLNQGQLHENEATQRIAAAIAGKGLHFSDISEGRINLIAERGLLCINAEALDAINSIEEMVVVTMHTGQFIPEERAVADTRVVPLVIDETKIRAVEASCAEHYPIIEIKPLKMVSQGL